MGALSNIGIPQVHGLNCTHEEWQDAVRSAIRGALQDEEEWGRSIKYWGNDLHREFPQLTIREFVNACGRLADLATETGR
jgi:hypothetical protein